MGRTRSKRLAGMLTALATTSIVLVGVAPAHAAPADRAAGASALATTSTATVVGDQARGLDTAEQAADYWTDERMRTALPADSPVENARSTGKRSGVKPDGAVQSVPPIGPKATVGTAAAQAAAGSGVGITVNASATVGRIFFYDPSDGFNHSCSGATVNSASKLLVMTAGHCVHGGQGRQWMQNWIFVPLYNYGSEPYGRWSAKYLTTFNAWINNSDLDRDVAWVTVWPNGSGQRPVDVVGGNGLSVNYSYEQYITILAYPADPPYDGGWQQYCQGTTSRPGIWPFQENKIQLHCGFTGGSSGAPWLRAYNGSLGYVNGVMSTLNSDGWNKSSYFDTAVMDVFNSVASRV